VSVPREQRRRLIIGGALGLAVLAVLVVLLLSGSSYEIRAQFPDAGQLVNGNVVQVAGRKVGSVTDISLNDSNQAEIKLKITDGEFEPLHEGTRATIRAIGLSGIANRYVELRPGPSSAPELRDGAVLKVTETRPYVELDAILNALDPKSRRNLQSLIQSGAETFHGTTKDANRSFHYASPAFSQLRALGDQIVADQGALETLISGSERVVSALASRQGALDRGIGSTAATLRAVASEQADFEDALARSPDVISRAKRTLADLHEAMAEIRPTLQAAQPGARPLARVIRNLAPAVRHGRPVVADLRALLPSLRQAMLKLPALTNVAVPALDSAVRTTIGLQPISEGLRPYTPDLIAGLGGFGGYSSGYYDANGHFTRIGALLGQDSLAGLASLVPPGLNVGDLVGYRTGLNERCPGGAVEPAADNSNPWIPDPSLCNHEDDHK
jgi:phospholipid/cholesterol/gamma-HCH transport system substrate-binding protein